LSTTGFPQAPFTNINCQMQFMWWDWTVGLASRLRARGSGDRIATEAKDFCPLQEIQTGSGAYQTPYSVGIGVLPRGYSSCGTWWHTRRNQISSFPETDESIWLGGGVSSVDCLEPRCAHQLE